MSLKSLINKFSASFDIEFFPDAVVIIDPLSDIIGWNNKAEEIFGYMRSEVIGKNIALILDDDIGKIHQSIHESINIIVTAKSRSGLDIIADISCARCNNDKNTIICIRDITKNQKIIERLLVEYEIAAKKAHHRSGFLAGYENELKAPLHSIIGFSQGILDGICSTVNDKQEKYAGIINKNANNLLALINNMTALSKMEIGEVQPSYKVFDIVELVESLKNDFYSQIEEKNLNFIIDHSENERRNIYSDENMLRQILGNLFSNAVKFTEIGTVKVKITCPDMETLLDSGIEVPTQFNEKSYLMILVYDTGIGLSDEDKPKIFNEFAKPWSTMTKKYGGTGLGLAVTKNLTEILNGKIWFESILGQGSVFGLVIPAERVASPQI